MIQPTSADKIHFAIREKIANGASYIDALIEYAKENNMTEEALGAIVKKSDTMKSMIWSEANKLNLLKKEESTVDIIELCN